jgi:flagellar motor switch protein FliM
MTSAAGLQPYDFRKPSGLPDQVEQRLLYWQRGLASLAPERWSQHMVEPLAMEPVGHESMLMIDARRQLPESAIGCQMMLGERESPTLFVISRPLTLAMIALVLGESLDALPADRLLTTIEQSLCELLCEELAVSVAEAWPDQEPLRCRIGGFEDKPQRSRLFALGQRVLLARFNVQGGFGSHEIHWIASQEPLEELLAQADVADADTGGPSRDRLQTADELRSAVESPRRDEPSTTTPTAHGVRRAQLSCPASGRACAGAGLGARRGRDVHGRARRGDRRLPSDLRGHGGHRDRDAARRAVRTADRLRR